MRKKIAKNILHGIFYTILIAVFVASLLLYNIRDGFKSVVINNQDENIPKYTHLLGNIKEGDVVSFGKYYDINKDNKLDKNIPIKWLVLDKNDDKALLITRDIIDMVKYNETWNPITYEDSSIRKWLNGDFYNMAFSDREKKFILDTYNSNDCNTIYATVAGNDTIDKVFLLSLQEVREHFKTNESTQAKGTKYAISKGLWISRLGTSDGYSVWWLRNLGRTVSLASLVHAGGATGESGDSISTTGNGARPCIWVKTY